MTGHIIVSDEESARTIVMRRPEKKNALNDEMFLAMADAINTAQSNLDIRCLILTGRSGVFTAGEDIGDFADEKTIERDEARPRKTAVFLRALVNNKKPIIAAVDGVAVGIGTTMVLHCDYVIAGTTSSFLSPFVQYGLVPEGASNALIEAQKVAREICALPAEAVAISRKLLKLPTEDMLRRMGHEEHLFRERMTSPSVIAAFKAFLSRKKK